ncbi:MAG: hypothetical protein ABIO49_00945 [Dokdonella sp.]
MSPFLRFLLAAYAPLAARHMLVDAQPFRSVAALPVLPPKLGVVEFSACIDIGASLRRNSSASEGLTSLAV